MQIANEIRAMPYIGKSVEAGQYFNAYNATKGGYIVGIGPVNECMVICRTDDARVANLLVAALRAASGQPPCVAPVV